MAATNFQVNGIDFDDAYVRKDVFTNMSSLWTWGNGASGQLANGGSGTGNHRSLPGQITADANTWKKCFSLASGSRFAIANNGTLWCWGYNANYVLGNGTNTNVLTPIKLNAGNNWMQVTSIGGLTAALKNDGTAWWWGNYANRSTPSQYGVDTDWIHIDGGYALKSNGSLYEMRLNVVNILNVTANTLPLNFGTNNKYISGTINYGGAIIKTDGTLWTFGNNNYGELGDNTFGLHRSSPVQVYGGGTWKDVSYRRIGTSGAVVGAITANGMLHMWGHNTNGNLGIGSNSHRSIPTVLYVTTSNPNSWMKVSAPNSAQTIAAYPIGNREVLEPTVALSSDGTAWSWGMGTSGQLGDNNTAQPGTTHRSFPGQIRTGQVWIDISSCMGITKFDFEST